MHRDEANLAVYCVLGEMLSVHDRVEVTLKEFTWVLILAAGEAEAAEKAEAYFRDAEVSYVSATGDHVDVRFNHLLDVRELPLVTHNEGKLQLPAEVYWMHVAPDVVLPDSPF